MTAIVGILCKDGIVIGSDSSVTLTITSQIRTIEQPTEKLEIIDGHIIVAGTGSVGLGQRFCQIIAEHWSKQLFKGPGIKIATKLSETTIQNFASTGAPKAYGALVAFPSDHKPYLCEFDLEHFQPELKTNNLWYCSMGSGQTIIDPFLGLMREIFWQQGQPDVKEGAFAAVWALEHAILVNPGGINGPPRLAILENIGKGQWAARMLDDSELDEHRQSMEAAKQRLRDFRTDFANITEVTPEPPKSVQ